MHKTEVQSRRRFERNSWGRLSRPSLCGSFMTEEAGYSLAFGAAHGIAGFVGVDLTNYEEKWWIPCKSENSR